MAHHWRDYVTSAYRAERDAQLERAERYAGAYGTDTADYFARVESRITFADILISARGYGTYSHRMELNYA